MLLDGLKSLFLQALRFDGNDATVLVMRWNEEIDYIQSVFDTMTNEKPKSPIYTNADYIRAMTDKELAEFILSIRGHCRAATIGPIVCPYIENFQTDCNKCWCDWLKQEIRE